MHYNYFSGRIYVEETSEQCCLDEATHRKPKRVSDGTSTQVRVQMINKCRNKMNQGGLYNMKNPPWERRRENGRQICNRALRVKYLRINVLGPIQECYSLTNLYYLYFFSIKTCFLYYLVHVTHSLQIYCFGLKSIYPLG